MEAGTRWTSELEFALQESRVGILCLTPENIDAPWVSFEAGALSRSVQKALVCPYLLGFPASELRGPLVHFQAVTADEQGTRRLLESINRLFGDAAVSEKHLTRIFDVFWPELNQTISQLIQPSARSAHRGEAVHMRAEGVADADILSRIVEFFSAAAPRDISQDAGPQYVFVVHGRNDDTKEAVARLIERLGPEVVILNERPSQGMTLIEKFEKYSNVDYAIVLMTGDDLGHSRGLTSSLPRARQNVVLELGYLLAKLGRSRVCVLYEPGTELPSDYAGVVYIPLDPTGSWKLNLARELRSAGLNVDLNRAL
jgi:predicted nucleotide-binding protein